MNAKVTGTLAYNETENTRANVAQNLQSVNAPRKVRTRRQREDTRICAVIARNVSIIRILCTRDARSSGSRFYRPRSPTFSIEISLLPCNRYALAPRNPDTCQKHDRRPNKEFTWNVRIYTHRQSVKRRRLAATSGIREISGNASLRWST